MDKEEKYSTQEIHERIDRFLAGEMGEEERRSFEAEVREDADLAREVDRLRIARRAVLFYSDMQLRQRLQAHGESLFPNRKEERPLSILWSKSGWLRWAAAIAILIICVFAVRWYSATYYNTSVLVGEYYQARKTPTFLSGDQNNPLQEGFNAYRQKKYDEAIAFFSQVPDGTGEFPTAQLFMGYAYFESGRYPDGINHFERVLETGDSRYKENAEWHRILALLAMNPQSEQARLYLDQIRHNPAHGFYDQAKLLHRKLNSVFKKIADMGKR